MLFPSGFGRLPGPFQLFPVTHGQAADVGGWGGVGGEVSRELETCPSSSRECLQGYFWPCHYPHGFGINIDTD